VTYTPTASYSGPDSFTFKVNDGALDSTPGTVSITVGNTAPVAAGQSQTTAEDTAKVITLSGTDANADPLTFAVGTAPTHGTLGAIGTPSCAAGTCTASVTYTPAANYNGPDSFTFTVNDGSITSPAATVSLTITAVNDAPVGNAQSQTTAEDTALVITLSASDLDSASLTFAVGTAPLHGTLGAISGTTCTPSGSGSSCTAQVTYTPALNYPNTNLSNGSDSFTFTANDGSLSSSAATVGLTITPVNDQPVAVNDNVTVALNSSNNVIAVLGNDTDVDADTLTVTAVTAATNGTASVGTGGANVVYTPIASFSGTDSFTYTISDGQGGTSTATVTVTVTGANNPPVSNGQSVTTPEDTATVITLSATDANNNTLAFAVVTAPTHGTLGTLGAPSCAAGTCTAQVTYTPAANYNGADSFTFKANDGLADSNVATVSLTITAVNDAPASNPQSATTAEDTAVTIPLSGTDIDSASLTFVTSAPAHGTLGSVTGTSCTPSGGGSSCTAQVTYTPAANYNGPDSFTYTTNDGSSSSAASNVSVTITAVNDAPAGSGQSVTAPKNFPSVITLTASDVDSPALTFAIGAAPTHGTLGSLTGTSCTPSGGGSSCTSQVTYTPTANYAGPDSFTFTVNDGTLGSGAATVSVTVANNPPVANGQSVTAVEDTALFIVLSGSDANGDSLTFAIGTAPTHGTLGAIGTPSCAAGSCTAQVTYTPAANYNGADSFTFATNDGAASSAAATVSITVSAVNDAPAANAQSVTTAEDTALLITLAGTDIDSASLTFAAGTAPLHGTLGGISGTICTPSGAGSSCTAQVTYTPAANYNGADSFTFTVNDGSATSPAATVSLTVTAVNDPPTFNTITNQTAAEDSGSHPVTITGISPGPTDESAQTVTMSATSSNTAIVPNPTVSAVSAGSATLTFNGAANANGTVTITVTANDGQAVNNTFSSTFTITVTGVNDAPTATAPSPVTTAEDTPVTITLAGADIDSAALTFAIGTAPANGTLGAITGTTCTPSGAGSSCTASVTYTPAANFNGANSFTFTVNDGSLTSTAATVPITVTAVNDAPVANAQNVTTIESTAVTITLAGTDVDGNSLTFAIGTAPTHGTLGAIGTPTCAAGSCTATVTYTPTTGYSGADSFTFTTNDGTLTSAAATVSITVNPVSARMIYSIAANTTPQTRNFIDSTNTFSAEANTVAGGTAIQSVLRSSPTKNEWIAGYVNASGVLQVMCYNGSAWTNEWSVTVGGTGTTRRFDIAYETNSGNAIILYSGNVATTNELRYRTKLGSTGCGSANWSAETNLDPIRTSGTVQWVKLAWDRRTTSNLITAIWADSNSDLSAMVWSGTAWGNEPGSARETSLETVAASQDVEDFDVQYESLSGDVMMVWANSAGADGTNGVRYSTCTGGTATCTWSAVTTPPTFADDATHLVLAANPNTDEMVFASIGNAGSDLQIGYWSGSAWTNTANVDTSATTPTAGTRFVAAGWLINGTTTRSVITYYDSTATNIGWYVGNAGTFTAQTDFGPTPVFGAQTQYDIKTDPINKDRLMFLVSDGNSDIFAKRLVMSTTGTFTWTNADGGAALQTNTASASFKTFDFAYRR
jgi:VCBS repeat-containing protein